MCIPHKKVNIFSAIYYVKLRGHWQRKKKIMFKRVALFQFDMEEKCIKYIIWLNEMKISNVRSITKINEDWSRGTEKSEIIYVLKCFFIEFQLKFLLKCKVTTLRKSNQALKHKKSTATRIPSSFLSQSIIFYFFR